MKLFVYLFFFGIVLIILGKLTIKSSYSNKKNIPQKADFISKFMSYIDSRLCGSINLKYGKLIFFSSGFGLIFYNTIGLFIATATVLVLVFYMKSIIINGYKYFKNRENYRIE